VTINLKCECGAACSADDSQLGQTIKCPVCGRDVPVQVPAEAPTAEVMAEGPSAMQDLQSTVGRGDVNEMIAQITGKRPADGQSGQPASPGAPAGTPSSAGTSVTSAAGTPAAPAPASAKTVAAALAKEAPKPRRKLPTGTARAAHHIGFKRVMWGVAVLVGLVCLGFAVYCFLPKSGPAIPPEPDFPVANSELVTDEHGKAWAMPKGATPSPQKNGKMCYYFAAVDQEGLTLKDIPNYEVVDEDADRSWAIPKGADHHTGANGVMYFRLTAKGPESGTPTEAPGATAPAANFWWLPREEETKPPAGAEGKTEPSALAKLPMDEDIPAVSLDSPELPASSVDSWLEAKESRKKTLADIAGRDAFYTNFGIIFAVVALALLALGVWMWTDVRTVRRVEEGKKALAEAAKEQSTGTAAPSAEGKKTE
jgi:hypothetical protein